MRKAVKIWLGIAVALIAVGLMLFGSMMTALKWDFGGLSTVKYDENEYVLDEAIHSISVVTRTADIVVVPSQEGGSASVSCYEQEKLHHAVSVRDGVLTVELEDTRKWYERIVVMSFKTPKITVTLPAGEYGSLSVKASTGDVEIAKDFAFESIDASVSTGDVKNSASAAKSVAIRATTGGISLENISAGALKLSVSTGRVTLTDVDCAGDVEIEVSTGKSILRDVTCQNLISSGDTGDISLKNVIASGGFSIERSTGDVDFEGCDAAEITIKTDTGDVEGSFLTEKVFIPHSDTGKVSVPDTKSGGVCRITTDTGDIKITIG